MNKEDLVNEIAKGNVSPIAFYNPDGSNMLYTQKYVEEKDKEIERLKRAFEVAQEELNKEHNRTNTLKNIINELEKYINKEFYVVGNSPKGSFYEGYDTCLIEMKQEILDKLKELKNK